MIWHRQVTNLVLEICCTISLLLGRLTCLDLLFITLACYRVLIWEMLHACDAGVRGRRLGASAIGFDRMQTVPKLVPLTASKLGLQVSSDWQQPSVFHFGLGL